MKTRILIFICLISCFSCSSQKQLYKGVDIDMILKEDSEDSFVLFPVFINGVKYEICNPLSYLKKYLRTEGVKSENIEQLIRDVYSGKRIFEGTDIGKFSYNIINEKNYADNFRDADLQVILKKYMRFDYRYDDDKLAIMKPLSYGKLWNSLTKYYILNNFSVKNDSFGHDMEIEDLNKGKTRLPLK